MRVGIVGAGQIARSYAQDLRRSGVAELVGVCDVVAERAEALAGAFSARAHTTPDDLLADGVDLVVNTTVFAAHAEVTRRCLRAGAHVYSEKPLATTPAEARELLDLARATGRRLGCAPCTLLGEAQQTAWRLVREGAIGRVRTVFAEAHGGPLEAWHPAPEPFYRIGPVADLAVYPLTLVTAMLGPVRTVHATGRVLRDERTTLDGTRFAVTTPDFVVAVLTLADGTTVRLSAGFHLPRGGRGSATVDLHGDEGTVHLGDWQHFGAPVERAGRDGRFAPVPLVRDARVDVENGRGVVDMIEAVATGRPHRCGAEQAAHVVDVLAAVDSAVRTGERVAVPSDFAPPAPLPWAEAAAVGAP
ncbi:Gfo/Idh/MocA family protein [Pseudonocardia lacus]|uniref:Gfo/Idh/MocA family protein n=1 Tax=Pseudonocardia lacus TaxID=2835865 RepID=UPI001BDD319D|nr:Gfo/Idh/MocA family oxidoreductase [Pseudonocardia lacus]